MPRTYSVLLKPNFPCAMEVQVTTTRTGRSNGQVGLRYLTTLVHEHLRLPCQFTGRAGGYKGTVALSECLRGVEIPLSPEALDEAIGRGTPYFEGEWHPQNQELTLHRLHRHAVNPRQDLLSGTVAQCLELFPDTASMFLDWVTHHQTRDIFVPVLHGVAPAPSDEATAALSPLLRCLLVNGFRQIELVAQGTNDFGFRAKRSAQYSFHTATRT